MGNQQSFQPHNDFTDLQTNYTYEKKYSDSRFGEIKLLRENSTGQKIFQKDFSSNTPKEFQEYVKAISDSTVLAHPNLLRVFGYNSKKEDMFCADFYKLSLFFESFDSDLEQEISRRRNTKDYFREAELWYILDSVASACAYLQKNQIHHKDIRPFNILITSKKDYKVSATNLFRQSYNPGYFGHFDDLEARSRYYSPELLRHFSKPEGQRTAFDENKNDVFALGMTILEAGNLEKVDGAYNFDKLEVKEAPIKEALERLRSRYSPNFVQTVEKALDFNPATRLDFIRLDSELSIYRRDIREQARGITESPVKTTEGKTTIIRPESPERHPVRAEAPVFYSDELDHRVREAVRRSEEVIKRSSPSKQKNKNLDPYIQSYLRNELKVTDQPILSQIHPYLTSESKYTTTLTIEQPSYGRESQPINFGQSQPREELGDHIKRSAYLDQPQQPNLQLQQAVSFGQPPQATTTYDHHHLQGSQGRYDQHYLTQSGISPGIVNYGTVGSQYGGATEHFRTDNYQINSAHASPYHANYGVTTHGDGHGDLAKRVEERLKQSRLVQH